jgi:hypothetical protein
MPGMLGDEVIQSVKQMYEKKRCETKLNILDPKYIILTAFMDTILRKKVESGHNARVYEKPLDLKTLR